MAKKKPTERGNVRVSGTLYKRLKQAAEREQRTMNALANILIERGIKSSAADLKLLEDRN